MKRNRDEVMRYQTFEDLEVYQVARELRKSMYRVAKRLPEEEKFGLTSQIRRAALSLTNNIAEGPWPFSLSRASQIHAAGSWIAGGIAGRFECLQR